MAIIRENANVILEILVGSAWGFWAGWAG